MLKRLAVPVINRICFLLRSHHGITDVKISIDFNASARYKSRGFVFCKKRLAYTPLRIQFSSIWCVTRWTSFKFALNIAKILILDIFSGPEEYSICRGSVSPFIPCPHLFLPLAKCSDRNLDMYDRCDLSVLCQISCPQGSCKATGSHAWKYPVVYYLKWMLWWLTLRSPDTIVHERCLPSLSFLLRFLGSLWGHTPFRFLADKAPFASTITWVFVVVLLVSRACVCIVRFQKGGTEAHGSGAIDCRTWTAHAVHRNRP